MGHGWRHDFPPSPDGEHPVSAVLAVIAIVLAFVLITWARFAVHGADDIEAALAAPPAAGEPALVRVDAKTEEERVVDAAVTANRFATGLSP